MTINDKIKDEKTQEATNTPALSSGKINKYEYLTSEEILPSDLSRTIEQATFKYSPLKRAFEKHKKRLKNKEKNKLQLQKFYITKKSTVKDGIPENTM